MCSSDLFATINPQRSKTGQESVLDSLSGSGTSFRLSWRRAILQPGKVSDPKAGSAGQIIIRVKGGKPGVKDVRNLRGVLDREKAAKGVLISVYPGSLCVAGKRIELPALGRAGGGICAATEV